MIPVAVLTTDDFDASTVDAATLVFAGAAADHWSLEDVDYDGDLDLIAHYRIGETDLIERYKNALRVESSLESGGENHQRVEVELTGRTSDGQAFLGAESVDLLMAGKKFRDLLAEL